MSDNLPALEFKDKPAWDAAAANTDDSIGVGIWLADRWGRAMQRELAEGKQLADIWLVTLDGIDPARTGTTERLAAQLLIRHWVHGSELERLCKEHWK